MSIWEIARLQWEKGYLLSNLRRRLTSVVIDAGALLLAFYFALLLHNGQYIIDQWLGAWVVLAFVVIIKIPVFALFGIYRISPTFLGLKDVIQIFKAITIGSIIFASVFFVLSYLGSQSYNLPILISDYLFTIVLVYGLRLAKRFLLPMSRLRPSLSVHRAPITLRRTLIAGAGNAGELTLRAILQEEKAECFPVALIDDDLAKQGIYIHGIPVLGRSQDIPHLVQELAIQELLIAMPSAPSPTLRKIVQLGQEAGVKKIRVLPALYDYINGTVTTSQIRNVKVEDLLGREPVVIDTHEISNYLKGSIVLVTGGAGSIGSELCQQIAKFHPQLLIILDQDETGLFYLRQNLNRYYPNLDLSIVVGDIQDKARVYDTFLRFQPQIVFHAAAYKHVSMMEENPIEALRNNVLGTQIVAEAACFYGATKFVLISTDKAVNPTSIMGATKRLAEMVIRNLNELNCCHFMAVRFGNVLGSRGSVVPIFEEQIQQGGPVTVTHPEMRRYFMTPSEAAVLVLQAGAMGEGGEIFVLDMGAPIPIVGLAKEMIKLAGLEPDKDIAIVFTQPSPGEKLFEDILTAEEGTLATKHQRIYIAKTNGIQLGKYLHDSLTKLRELVKQDNIMAAMNILCELIPNFNPANGLYFPDTCTSRPPIPEEQLTDYQWLDIQGRLDLYESENLWEEKSV